MPSTIITKNGSGAPLAADLVAGELAVDLTNGRLYTENSGGSVIEIGLNPSGNVDVTGTVTLDDTLNISGGSTTAFVQASGSLFQIGASTASSLVAYTNNAERMRIATTGQLLVGSGTSPASGEVKQTLARAGSSYLEFQNTSTNTGSTIGTSGENLIVYTNSGALGSEVYTERMRIDASGNVGIGVSSLVTGSTRRVLQVSTGSDGGQLALADSTTEAANPRIFATNKEDLKLSTANTATGTIQFITGSTPTERMRIDSSGNVGIGTDSPSGALHVYGGSFGEQYISSSTSAMRFVSTGGANYIQSGTATSSSSAADLIFTNVGGSGETMRIDSSGAVIVNNSGGDAQIYLGGSSGTSRMYLARTGTAAALWNVDNGVMQFGTNNAEAMRIDASGNLLVGRTAASNTRLHVEEIADKSESAAHFRITGSGYSAFHWLDANGYYIGQNSASRSLRLYSSAETAGAQLSAGATSFTTFSDERLKENIEPVENALQSLSGLRTVKYHLKDVDSSEDKKKIGVIAQDLVGVIDEVIDPTFRTGDDTEYMGVRYTELVPVLIKAIQELEARIAQLEGVN